MKKIEPAPLAELTIKAIILGIILAILLGAANAYLSLKVGIAISASIPAAIISMGVLRFFKHSNMLENNIVQTAASSGEALTAGIAFTIPALLVVGSWHHFHYWETVAIALLGGWLGILLIIPIRKTLLNKKELLFPEGTAIGKVLMVSQDKQNNLKPIVSGSLIGAIITVCQSGLRVLSDSAAAWFHLGPTVVGFGAGFSPALIAAGYIVGIEVAISLIVGVIIGWVIGVPMMGLHDHTHLIDAATIANQLWAEHIRYLGIGIMLVGGLCTMLSLLKPMAKGIKASIDAAKHLKEVDGQQIERQDHSISLNAAMKLIILFMIPVIILIYWVIERASPGISLSSLTILAAGSSLLVFILSFLVSTICAYFAGLVGSSTSPVSAIYLIVLIIAALTITAMYALFYPQHVAHPETLGRVTLAITLTAILAVIGALSNDNIQDLKAGQIVGATPWKQQVMQMIGVTSAAFVIPLVLRLLYNAYGIAGAPPPHPGMDPSQMLSAPQAGLIAAVVEGIIRHQLQWGLIAIGCSIALLVILTDIITKRRGYRLHVLAVGIGVYLPLAASLPLIFGGLVSYFVNRRLRKRENKTSEHTQHGLLLCCGLVAGASLMGVFLAIPFVIMGSSNALAITQPTFAPIAAVLSVFVTVALCYWIYRTSVSAKS